MDTILQAELINYIFEYENPYKSFYSNNVIKMIKSKYIYTFVMKQLKQYCVYNKNKEPAYFMGSSYILGVIIN